MSILVLYCFFIERRTKRGIIISSAHRTNRSSGGGDQTGRLLSCLPLILRVISRPRKSRRRSTVQMSSLSWNMFDNLPGPSSITENLASGAKVLSREYEAFHQTLFPGYHALQKCSESLQEIKGLLEGLSEHRRRKIQLASKRGVCLSLESLELDLERSFTTLLGRSLRF